MAHDPEQALQALERSTLLAPDVPKRVRVTHAEQAARAEGDVVPGRSSSAAAIAAVGGWQELAEHVRTLGKARHAPAVPLLARLWRDCAVHPVRVRVGHALRAIGTTEARSVLVDLIDDADHLSVFLGVRAIFDADPLAAFDRVAPYFEVDAIARPGGDVIPHQVLATFVPSMYTKAGPGFTEPRAPAWFRDDPRWMDLCLALRRHAMLGNVARKALRHGDPALVGAALRRALEREGPRVVTRQTSARGDLLARYERGEREIVWRELRSFGAIDGALRDEALAVANATMRRVLADVEILATRLSARGWTSQNARFLHVPASSLHTPPVPEDATIAVAIERTTGARLPPSLKAFWEVVGGVDFVWDYYRKKAAPTLGVDLDMTQLDPLSIVPARATEHVFEEWHDSHDGVDPELADPYALDLAPDYLHKANISGGAAYGVLLPFHGADPVFENEVHALPFVDYLRLCMRWGGFPLLERHADRPDVRAFVREMTADLEPF